MNKEEKKQYMKVWYQKNKRRVLKKQQKIRDDAKIVSPLEKKIAKLESDFRICEKNADTYYDQLTKAKELLKRCYENYIYLEPLRSEINQFLKEIEE